MKKQLQAAKSDIEYYLRKLAEYLTPKQLSRLQKAGQSGIVKKVRAMGRRALRELKEMVPLVELRKLRKLWNSGMEPLFFIAKLAVERERPERIDRLQRIINANRHLGLGLVENRVVIYHAAVRKIVKGREVRRFVPYRFVSDAFANSLLTPAF